jgi:hypothetical protein
VLGILHMKRLLGPHHLADCQSAYKQCTSDSPTSGFLTLLPCLSHSSCYKVSTSCPQSSSCRAMHPLPHERSLLLTDFLSLHVSPPLPPHRASTSCPQSSSCRAMHVLMPLSSPLPQQTATCQVSSHDPLLICMQCFRG